MKYWVFKIFSILAACYMFISDISDVQAQYRWIFIVSMVTLIIVMVGSKLKFGAAKIQTVYVYIILGWLLVSLSSSSLLGYNVGKSVGDGSFIGIFVGLFVLMTKKEIEVLDNLRKKT